MHEELYNQFESGFFAVNTTCLPFSKIGYDQTQEHNIKTVKSTAGYIDLVIKEDATFLRKLEDWLPEIHDYLSNIKSQAQAKMHKEMAASFVTMFKNDCQKLLKGNCEKSIY